jgi:hypothetical protein
VFPVVNTPADSFFYDQYVTVPLAADILKKTIDQPVPNPMPLMMEDNIK